MDQVLQQIIAAIVAMNVTTKPNVKDITVEGVTVNADLRDQAWAEIEKQRAEASEKEPVGSVTTDQPDSKDAPTPNPDEQTAKELWVRVKSHVYSTRIRAGHKFTRDWTKVDGQTLSAAQEKFLREDKSLEVKEEAPATAKTDAE